MKTRFREFVVPIYFDREKHDFDVASARAEVLSQFDAWRKRKGITILGIKWAAEGDFGVTDPDEGQHCWVLEVLYEVAK